MTAKIIEKKVMLPKMTVARGERKVDKIVFSAPAEYEGIDLTVLDAYANIRRGDNTTDKISLQKSGSGENFTVTWNFNASVTAVAGELEARISFESGDGDVVFMTERFAFDIEDSTDAYEDYTNRDPNALYEQRQMMAEYVVAMQEIVEEIGAMVEWYQTHGLDIQVSADNVIGLATVAQTGSYNDLTDKPDITSVGKQEELILKYVSNSDDTSTQASLLEEDRAVFKKWAARFPDYSRLILEKSQKSIVYRFDYKYFRQIGNAVTVYYTMDDGSAYSMTYNIAGDSLYFNEG